MTWCIAAVSLAGVVLNIRRQRASFALWFVSNLAWCAVDWQRGVHAQAALMLVYAGLSVWGWVAWGKTTQRS